MSSFDLSKRVSLVGDSTSKRLKLFIDGEKVTSISRRALAAAVWDVVGSVYLPMSCPRCRRRRLEFNGRDIECEKCGWVPDKGGPQTIILKFEYDEWEMVNEH